MKLIELTETQYEKLMADKARARELERENARLRNALEVLRDRRDWISVTDVDAFIRNALLPNDEAEARRQEPTDQP